MTLLAALAWLRNHQEGKIKYRERLYIWGSEIKLSEVFDTEHDGWSVVEPPAEPKRRTKIVKVFIDSNGRYCMDPKESEGYCLDAIFRIPNWTGRLEVTFADGEKKVIRSEYAFGAGKINGIFYNYTGQDDFIPATITGVEFWN